MKSSESSVVRVKICGITNLEDALVAIEAGADMLGFVFAASPRQVTPEQALRIIEKLPDKVEKVGVFVNADLEFVKQTMDVCRLDQAQLHGNETPEYCAAIGVSKVVKAFRVQDASVLDAMKSCKASAYLLDAYDPARAGGTGRTFDWDIARKAGKYGKIVLSGGLNPDNVKEAVATVNPYGVDVSSGVEATPGKKDPAKVKAFIAAARASSKERGDQ